MLTPVYEEDFALSPELEERLEEGRRQYRAMSRPALQRRNLISFWMRYELVYSRRISKNDRLIYDIYEEKVTVLVLTVEGHYDDK